MMQQDSQAELVGLFTALEAQLRGEASLKALLLCDQILALAPGDEDALRTKVFLLLHQGSHDQALALLRLPSHWDPLLTAYALYRSGPAGHGEALTVLASAAADDGMAATHLTAQLQFRQGAYDSCIATYASAPEMDAAAQTNLVAAYVCAGRAAEVPRLAAELGLGTEASFESLYNVACAALARGELAMARQLLETAMANGRTTLHAEGMSEREVEEELLPIAAQLAHVACLMGCRRGGIAQYAHLLSGKPRDVATTAVATSNLVAARGACDVFDGQRRLDRLVRGDGLSLIHPLDSRLSGAQQAVLSYNRASMLLQGGQPQACRALLEALEQRSSPATPREGLLMTALLVSEGNFSQADELLTALVHDSASVEGQLMHAQLAAAAGRLEDALAALNSLPPQLRHTPRVVATRSALSSAAGVPEAAEAFFADAIGHWETAAQAGCEGALERASVLIRTAAELMVRQSRLTAAVALYERLLAAATSQAGRAPALAGLAAAYAGEDLDTAELHVGALAGQLEEPDAEELEALWRSAIPVVEDQPDAAPLRKQPRKRLRKPRWPRDFDPTAPNNPLPDPERWLPLRLRSSYKPKRTKKGAVRGPRGVKGASK